MRKVSRPRVYAVGSSADIVLSTVRVAIGGTDLPHRNIIDESHVEGAMRLIMMLDGTSKRI